MPPIRTVAEAVAQVFSPPERFDDRTWRGFAASIDDYAIARKLGFDLRERSFAQAEP